jgi:hypothetical protein
MMVRLFRDHYEHKDGKVIRHRKGEVVDLPEAVVRYIATAEIEQRRRLRAEAAKYPGTPEHKP